MRQVKQVFAKIKKTISSINFKSKKTLVFIGLFLVALASSAILISYSYYTNPGTNNLVIGGYAFISDADITLKIYHEDRDAEGNGTGTYSRAYFIPREYYKYVENMSYCTTGLTIESFENYEFDISATQKGFCKVYFEAIDGYIPDATFRLFVEQNMGAGDYEEAGQLPVNDYVYVVNQERTTCSDPNAVVEIVNRKIEVSTSTNLDCEIYADIKALTGGGKINYLNEAVIAMEDGFIKSSSQSGGGSYRVVDQNGIRYEGKDPDNYVEYNGEEWRIIGTFDGEDIGLDEGEQYTKIIKNTPIGNMYWNYADENDWVNSTLYQYLNGTYYSSLSKTAKNMIAKYNNAYSTWYLLGPTYSDIGNYYTPDMYLLERQTGSPGYRNGVAGAADSSVDAAIGLMYPSDYGYAAYGASCNNESTETLLNYSGACAAVDWLKFYGEEEGYNSEWLLSPISNHDKNAIVVYCGDGSITYNYIGNFTHAIRPTLYLSENVIIESGDGSKGNAYKLKLQTEEKVNYLSDTVVALANGQDRQSSQANGGVYRVINPEVSIDDSIVGTAGIRYQGKDPDNYVQFNGDELWRMIGAFDGDEIGLDSGEKYIKLINPELVSIGYWYNDLGGQNDWVNSDLNKFLNGDYFQSLNENTRNMIAPSVTYYLGAVTSGDIANYTSSDYFVAERGNIGTAATPTILQHQNSIGLMYLSDYGYAMYAENEQNGCNTGESLSEYKNCDEWNWLFKADNLNIDRFIYTITGASDDDITVFTIEEHGYILNWFSYDVFYHEWGSLSSPPESYPVLYLKSDVFITGGDGSQANPYTLDIAD